MNHEFSMLMMMMIMINNFLVIISVYANFMTKNMYTKLSFFFFIHLKNFIQRIICLITSGEAQVLEGRENEGIYLC